MSVDRAIEAKLRRLASGKPARVLDLFSGCGGLSLGFRAAGCEIVAGVEMDPHAAKSHAWNFHGVEPDVADTLHRPRDITETNPEALVAEFRLGRTEHAIDIIVGGPPCQAFARVGRSKLREVQAHPEAFRHDSRAQLYLSYLDYVRQLRPVALLMENVSDMLNHGGQNLAEEVCAGLGEDYVARYTVLNAVHYGVPQMRERMILVALRKELGLEVTFPEATHRWELPRGYAGYRDFALKLVRRMAPGEHHHVEAPAPPVDAPEAVTARQALDDLPPIPLEERDSIPRGARRLDRLEEYVESREPSDYASRLRMLPGVGSELGVYDHEIRRLGWRDWNIFADMEPGQQYPEAHAIALGLLKGRLAELGDSAPREGTARYRKLVAEHVPPYDPGKFPNKWWMLQPDAPVRTLMAHLGKDSYSHIHYEPEQARPISVREAARLQGFPDRFRFAGTMNPAFQQIGNAVPPPLAKALAAHMLRAIHANARTAVRGSGTLLVA